MNEAEFEQEIEALQSEARERRQKLKQRLEMTAHAIESVEVDMAAYALTLTNWRRLHGIERSEAVSPTDLEAAEELRDMPVRQALIYWAKKHGGGLVVNDLAKAYMALELFQDKERAAATLYATLGRIEGFEKEARGRYRLLEAN